MIVDDDLGAFTAALNDKEVCHEATVNRLCCNLLTQNRALSDSYNLCSTEHANLASVAGVPSKTTLTAARLGLRQQVGPAGRLLNLPLQLILVPPELETTVQELLDSTLHIAPPTSNELAGVSSGADVFRSLPYIVEGELSSFSTTAWWAFSFPAYAAIVVCFQKGFERMAQRSYYNPKNNCRIWQFEGRFAAAVQNYRGVYKNSGE
jgi:hypothetical protein